MDERNYISPQVLMELYTMMLEIRKVELKIAQHYPEDEMRTPIHLCIGQEAVAAGVCAKLKAQDYVFSNHRGHGHYIAQKGSLNALIAELYNKETGCARGRGGSMHLADPPVGLLGSSSIVAGGIPIAAGAALASALRNDARVAVAFFGDGAAEEGVLYESLNFAALKKLPVIFVCENNLYSVCSPLNRRQPGPDIYKRAEGFSVPACSVDGNDVIAVYKAAGRAIDNARQGKGPYFIECKTYRLTDHHDRQTGVETGYRTQEEWDEWAARCPIKKLAGILKEQYLIGDLELKDIEKAIDEKIEEAFDFARTSPFPDKNELYKYLYG
ncbi:MAG: thiamine pyrophosphate-dependent dehydrogenase E1 component subunit alpha [Syntrophomonas sp.]